MENESKEREHELMPIRIPYIPYLTNRQILRQYEIRYLDEIINDHKELEEEHILETHERSEINPEFTHLDRPYDTRIDNELRRVAQINVFQVYADELLYTPIDITDSEDSEESDPILNYFEFRRRNIEWEYDSKEEDDDSRSRSRSYEYRQTTPERQINYGIEITPERQAHYGRINYGIEITPEPTNDSGNISNIQVTEIEETNRHREMFEQDYLHYQRYRDSNTIDLTLESDDEAVDTDHTSSVMPNLIPASLANSENLERSSSNSIYQLIYPNEIDIQVID